MNDLYNRIEALCERRNIKISDLCRATGIRSGSFSDLKHGRIKKFSTETVEKIALHFDVSVDYLLGKEQQKKTAQMDGLSETDKTILSLLDELSPQEREKAVAVLKALVDKQ